YDGSSYIRSCSCLSGTASLELSTLSLHDALPISDCARAPAARPRRRAALHGLGHARRPWRRLFQHRRNRLVRCRGPVGGRVSPRSEEHTSELQSRGHLVSRLLLEKKNSTRTT